MQPSEKLEISSDVDKVDYIVAERKYNYQVCWLGYNVSEDTWVSKEEL